jgi:hypothetical protein
VEPIQNLFHGKNNMINLIKSSDEWDNTRNDTHIMIRSLYERGGMLIDKRCREFLLFCANQIWDLLDNDEKDVVNEAQQYLDGILTEPHELYKSARLLAAKSLGQPTTLEGKFNASKSAIAAGCAMCTGQPDKSLYRAMDRAAYEVRVLHTMDQTMSGGNFIKPTPDAIQTIGLPYCQAQVVKLKEIFINPF